MQKIPKPEYPVEFKEQAVKRVKDGKSVGAVAKEMGLVEQTLRNWVKASAASTLDGPGTPNVMPDEMELSRLRAENLRLKCKVEILKKRRRTSRGMRCEIRLDRCAPSSVRPE
jgi:transposase